MIRSSYISLFYCCVEFHCMYTPQYICTLDIIILWGCCWLLSNENNDMVNILYNSLGVHGCAFQGYILMSGIVGHRVADDTFFKCSTTFTLTAVNASYGQVTSGDYQQLALAAISILALLMVELRICYFPAY